MHPDLRQLQPIHDEVRRHHPDVDLGVIATAFGLLSSDADAERALDVTQILAELRLDPASLAAAIAAPSSKDPREIAETCAPEVADLAASVRRLRTIEWNRLEQEDAEKLRKMFLAMVSDIRVVLIELADRLHSMRTMTRSSADERRHLALEAQEVFAPLANRLGVWQVKWQLEDAAFRELQPDLYRQIRDFLAEKRAHRDDYIQRVIGLLREHLTAEGIPARISGRPKHIYSIYKKMLRKNVGFDQVYDVSAVRIVTDRIQDCYAALGLVHGLWTPITDEFDDYIAKPKNNFYQSLHTAVLGPEQRPLEIQIRTREMHEFAEYGVAAHWRYKEGARAAKDFEQKINWLRQLMEWQKEVTDPGAFVESLKTDVFQDQVYVFTPGGDILDLPEGSTPVDFAYRVHTEVGHRCRGAKVNGQMVPLDRPLETGDRIEVVTTKTGGPSRDWLNPHLGYVRTSGAKQKIRQWFRRQDRAPSITQGKELLDRELKRLGLEQKRPEDVAELLGYGRAEDLLAALGFGDHSIQQVGTRLLEAEQTRRPAPEEPTVSPETSRSRAASVSTAGIDDVLSQPAKCCRPVPGDPVIGYITKGRGMTIHRRDCPNMRNPGEPERLVSLQWQPKTHERYPISIKVMANDRPGLLRDIADVITNDGINLASAQVTTHPDQTATITATLDVRAADQAVRVLNRLERLPYVQLATRTAG